MQTKLSVQTEGDSGTQVHDFELASTDLAFIPNIGDLVQLPGMVSSVTITSREFIYENPSSLQVWLNYDVEE
jgi:hypothetical protein